MKYLSILFILLLSISSNAEYYNQLNHFDDQECPTWTSRRFNHIERWITFGVEGARDKGYTYEFPISRKGVDIIWCALEQERGAENASCRGVISFYIDRPFRIYAGTSPVDNHKFLIRFKSLEDQYNHYLAYVKEVVKAENMKKVNVGAVLEILSRYYLQELTNEYPVSDYTISSGVAYHKEKGDRTIGELDIIVFEKASCEVIAVGESKASSRGNLRKSLKKAKGQLKRFRNFLKSNY